MRGVHKTVFLHSNHLHQRIEQFDSVENNHSAADAVQPCEDDTIDFAAKHMDYSG